MASACGDGADVARTGPPATPSTRSAPNPLRNAYFGDLHIHSVNSFDVPDLGVRATPDDAYRYAAGEAIAHPLGYKVRLRGGPLDFYAVTDHAEYLGMIEALKDPEHPHPLAKKMQSGDPREHLEVVIAFSKVLMTGEPVPDLDVSDVVRSVWQENIESAERHNRPGRFTTFVGYEYASMPEMASLHRNVIFASNQVPEVPFSAVDSLNPEDLWSWLDAQRAKGIEALAIPHNSNWSEGMMFQRTNWAGAPIDAGYAEQRIRNEPLIEITQVKGTSETHPALSPTDEWADFELWKHSRSVVGEDGSVTNLEGATSGGYAREALRTGLELEVATGKNPYQFGFIGSTDSHNAASPVEEDHYFGKFGTFDGSPEGRGSVPRKEAPEIEYGLAMLEWGSSGLTGVWAEENTRQSIYSALRRKEAFGTSGPRIRVRFFAGYDYADTLIDARDAIPTAYANGVPMGGELSAKAGAAPRFFVWALRDPAEAWLQRAQIVKGWMAGGSSHEQVFDVACSDGLKPDAKTHRCPDNGASVNLDDCSTTFEKGAVELKTVWRDPTFDPDQPAFYYLRVLQNPTCRWSTWDAVRAGVAPNPEVPATLQERAWSSPIWVSSQRR